jgi:hypothetical protein
MGTAGAAACEALETKFKRTGTTDEVKPVDNLSLEWRARERGSEQE